MDENVSPLMWNDLHVFSREATEQTETGTAAFLNNKGNEENKAETRPQIRR